MKIQTLKNLKTQELNTNFQFTWISEKNKKTQKNGKLWISQEIQFSFELRNLVGCFVGFFFPCWLHSTAHLYFCIAPKVL